MHSIQVTDTLPLNVLLTESVAGAVITRMEYDRFDELITAKYCVVVRNWPLKKFCNPGNVTTRIELELLYRSWESGTTFFEQLSREAMRAWEDQRFSSHLEVMGPPADPVPALAPPQPPAVEMTLFSELSQQDHLALNPLGHSTAPIQHAALAPVTNLTPGPVLSATQPLPAPNPELIDAMIHADPALQNVDPALIAMSIPETNLCQPSANLVEQQPVRPRTQTVRSKGRWQEVVTPLSYGSSVAGKPKRHRKRKDAENRVPTARGVTR